MQAPQDAVSGTVRTAIPVPGGKGKDVYVTIEVSRIIHAKKNTDEGRQEAEETLMAELEAHYNRMSDEVVGNITKAFGG